MSLIATTARTFALESSAGRFLVGTSHLIAAHATRDPYLRASALLRAWRATDQSSIGRITSAYLREVLTRNGELVPLAENPLLRSWVNRSVARSIRQRFAQFDLADRVRMRLPRPNEGIERQGNLMLLKAPDAATGEKGVILLKYTETFRAFAALYEIERLVRDYMIVLEPSWWGYKDASFFLLAGSDSDVVVQSQAQPDYDFLAEHGFGMMPIRVGAGDWINPDLFQPSSEERRFDVVMVSSWNPYKRHRDLFAALKTARSRHGRTLRTALIGYPNGWTVDRIRHELDRFGIADQCEVLDSISQQQVAEIVSRSRVYVLLSRREGANKAMYEAMFCNTPVLVPRHHRGVNLEHLNRQTGMTFDPRNLTDTLIEAVDRSSEFSPREWAMRMTGYRNATRQLDEELRRVALSRGRTWKQSIEEKKNQPNLLYAHEADRLALDPAYERLAGYLRAP